MNDHELRSLPAAKSAIEAPPDDDRSLRVPCYCEENVWRLAYRKLYGKQQYSPPTTEECTYHVAFVSNPEACVPMFQQLAARDKESPVFWDYHVILLKSQVDDSGTLSAHVLDVDSHLPYPCSLKSYIDAVFPNHTEWKEEYLPNFRVIDASVYLRNFSSDRSHMFDSETKTWSAPPPLYDCILSSAMNDEIDSTCNKDPTTKTTFQQYMTISKENINDSLQQQPNSEGDPFGRVYSLSQLLQRFRINN